MRWIWTKQSHLQRVWKLAEGMCIPPLLSDFFQSRLFSIEMMAEVSVFIRQWEQQRICVGNGSGHGVHDGSIIILRFSLIRFGYKVLF